jgi:surface protein
LFSGSDFNGDISHWDVSNVKDMSGIFWESKFTRDISRWIVSNVISMRGMFYRSPFNGDISKWKVSNVTDMSSMFAKSKFKGDLSNWDVSNVTDMRYMFSMSKFKGDLGNWDVSNVLNMKGMFFCSEFRGNIDSWNVKKETKKDLMFWGCSLRRLPKWSQFRDAYWLVNKYIEESTLNSIIKYAVESIRRIDKINGRKSATGQKIDITGMLEPIIYFITKDCLKNDIDTAEDEIEAAAMAIRRYVSTRSWLLEKFNIEDVQKEKDKAEQAKIKQMLTSDAEDNQAST